MTLGYDLFSHLQIKDNNEEKCLYISDLWPCNKLPQILIFIVSYCFWASGIWKQLSWVVLAQGLLDVVVKLLVEAEVI